MGAVTEIAWTDHTFNGWWGCSRVSPACRFCYAADTARRWDHDVWHRSGPRRMLSDNNWKQPLAWNRAARRAGRRERVFCASMSDVFEQHPVPEINAQLDGARARLWDLIADTPWLVWQLLTKRPENVPGMAPWGDRWPDNVWLGTSVESQRWAVQRIGLLVDAGAQVNFLSCEPLLGPVDLTDVDGTNYLDRDDTGHENGLFWVPGPRIDWVIGGGESGPKARPTHPDWARGLRDQCAAAGVPFFWKQWGAWQDGSHDPRTQHGPEHVVHSDGRHVLWTAYEGSALARHHSDVGNHPVAMARVGKKAAGRLLDGVEHLAYPDLGVPTRTARHLAAVPAGEDA
jgi:protein gp37